MSATGAVPKWTANDRLRNAFASWFWGSMIAATLIHFGAFALWPQLTAEVFSVTPGDLEAIEFPPEVVIPPPPRIARPTAPMITQAEIEADVTIVPATFEENPVEMIVPPPERGTTGHARPRFTALYVAPEIQNRNDVIRATRREYPPLLRDAGISGTVRVLFLIDENGRVQDTRIDQSSGHRALDRAALNVAEIYRFSPALNRDTPVPIWVSLPIVFQVR